MRLLQLLTFPSIPLLDFLPSQLHFLITEDCSTCESDFSFLAGAFTWLWSLLSHRADAACRLTWWGIVHMVIWSDVGDYMTSLEKQFPHVRVGTLLCAGSYRTSYFMPLYSLQTSPLSRLEAALIAPGPITKSPPSPPSLILAKSRAHLGFAKR